MPAAITEAAAAKLKGYGTSLSALAAPEYVDTIADAIEAALVTSNSPL